MGNRKGHGHIKWHSQGKGNENVHGHDHGHGHGQVNGHGHGTVKIRKNCKLGIIAVWKRINIIIYAIWMGRFGLG